MSFLESLTMTDTTLVSICRHDLRLEDLYDIARLIGDVKIIQEDSSDIYAKLTGKDRVNAREILSADMLSWVCSYGVHVPSFEPHREP